MTTASLRPALADTVPRAARITADWRQQLNHRIIVTDVLVVVAAVLGAQLFRFSTLLPSERVVLRTEVLEGLSYTVLSIILIGLWLWALALSDSRSDRVVGEGVQEYRRVTTASLGMFGAIAIAAYLLQVDVARGYLLISLPLGLAGLLVTRRAWRQWLVRKRAQGSYLATVLLVGNSTTVGQIATELQRIPAAGYRVVGACVSGEASGVVPGTTVPVCGGIDDITKALRLTGADTVAISGSSELPPDRVKRIAWSLETSGHQLVLAPSLIDVAGPRIHTRDVAGLPLIHVEMPQFTPSQRFVKRAFDLVVATLGLIVVSPLMLVLALVVDNSGPGGVLFRQTRIGRNGKPFTMLKFRSMVNNAEELRAEVVASRGERSVNSVLFKDAADPRTTPAGRWMRRYSLDELPQLLNVLAGSMSLVGPRPHVESEVAEYEEHAHRRLRMKQGMTGLWQVSGRNQLTWDESVRLDLWYVENWSLFLDLVILFRTVRAVVRPGDTTS